MQITIDEKELRKLQNEVAKLTQYIEELEHHRTQYTPENIDKRIEKAAYALFESYLKTVFKQLGFNSDHKGIIAFQCGFPHRNKQWNAVEDIKISVGAEVEEGFRTAFLRIGVVTKTEEQIKEESLLEKYS